MGQAYYPERRSRPRGRGLTLQLNIVSAFAAVLLVILSTMVIYAYVKNAQSILDLTHRFVDQVSASGISRTVALLEPASAHVRGSAEVAAQDEVRARDGSLFPYLIGLLDTTPQLQSLYFAFDDGRFLQAFSIPPGRAVFGANNRVPPDGAAFALRVVDRPGGVYSDVWTYVTRDGREVGRETSDSLNYDHRNRDWYKQVKERRELIWTDLVVFTSNRQPGIAAVYPIIGKDGRFIGATAANISTGQLSDFLSGLDLGRRGIAVLIDEKEQLIAYPDASRVVTGEGAKLSLVKISDLKDERLTDAFAAYRANPEKVLRFESKGRSYLGAFLGLPKVFGKSWLFGVVVLEDDYVGLLKENTSDIVMVGLILMAVGVAGMMLLSRWISRPLAAIGTEIDKIQKFELSKPIVLHARVTEVNQLIDSLNMMKRALRTFGMFVPQDLVRDLVGSGRPIELGGQDRPLTVMFTDIADFTGLSERMEAGALLRHVSLHLAAMSACIGREGGTVDKYIGDAVMAFWGAPTPCADHALRACIAAVRAKRVQADMNARWAAEGLPTIFVRIGIHTASVIVGNIGSDERMSYTAVGDGVNVASRLEGVNKVYGSQICISAAVLREAGESVLARPLDLVAVKGRKAGELVFELLGIGGEDSEVAPGSGEAEMCALTRRAFDAYTERRWAEAEALYGELAAGWPGDRLAAVFQERCRAFAAEPPPADWNGVYEMKSK